MDELTQASVLRSLGELHAKVDILLESRTKHDARITHLERKQWAVSGAVALVATVFIPKIKSILGL